MPSNGLKKGGGQQTDSLKKGAQRRPQHVCVCVCKSLCQWTLCICVFEKFFLKVFFSCRWCSDGNWNEVYPYSPPFPALCGCLQRTSICFVLPFLPVVKTHLHTYAYNIYKHMSPLAHGWLLPGSAPPLPLHPAPRPPLSRITPAVKVIALPASLLCCIKASLCSFYSAYCFLIICLHHTMHLYSTGRLSYLYQSCPQGTSPCSDLSMMEPSVKSTLYVSQLWKSNYNITIGAARIAIYNRGYSRMREVYQEN